MLHALVLEHGREVLTQDLTSIKKLVELINIQFELLLKGSIMVAPGGKLAYVTCSILPEEGVDQIQNLKNQLIVIFLKLYD